MRASGDEQLIDALLGLARCSLDELAGEGVATSADSLESYRGPVRTSRISIGSPTFHYRVVKMLRSDGEQALRYAAQLAETRTLTSERRVAVLLRVGDWFQAKDHSRTARRYYASAQLQCRHLHCAAVSCANPREASATWKSNSSSTLMGTSIADV